MFSRLALTFAFAMCAGAALAQPARLQTSTDKFHVTDVERAACQSDAIALCSSAFPDEDALLTCMKASRPGLTSGCRVVFEAGLRRRHIPF